ncbi:HAD family hydrolase [Solibacillus sp. CAU 1738]|uniref:HAD family hydrolase n=1 Tax=Solibacillus sp. CAU 1738 TaxID=3140363 RepID=UPI003260CB3C
MKNYKVILFDLDGTLSDPKIGITKSVQYALEKMGINEPNINNLEPFIGPPLQVSFSEFYGFNQAESTQAIAYYRERFKKFGMFENALYKGIPTLLKMLKSQGYLLAIATSKPTVFAEEILKYFDIDHYFDIIGGSNLDGTRSAKGEIIAFVMQHFEQYSTQYFIMIGDRKHDIIGAIENNIESIGVTYGYGSNEELQLARATYIVDSVEKLGEFFNTYEIS